VEEALKRGAGRVYAGTRTSYTHPDKRVTPLVLDVTNAGPADTDMSRDSAMKALERQNAAFVAG
jgi:hypothetical protein